MLIFKFLVFHKHNISWFSKVIIEKWVSKVQLFLIIIFVITNYKKGKLFEHK
jgi:hypothetical protein